MKRWRPLRLLTSIRTTVVLLCLLAVLLLLNIVIPQAAVIGEEAFASLVAEPGPGRFFLHTLGLGRMATSPLFLAALALFFVNLAAVLAARATPTWRRTRPRPRSAEGLRAWAALPEARRRPVPAGWGVAAAVRTLRGFGYRGRKVGDGLVWGVKHRTAPLGFLLFHLSFFLLSAGGALLYYTRFVGTAVLTEGQSFDGGYKQVLRAPPAGRVPPLAFTLQRVEARFEAGEPTHLGAVLTFQQAGGVVERRSSINHPAHWGAASIFVQQAGLAPVLWLQDAAGFTVDRVAAPAVTRGEEATRVPMAGGRLEVVIAPRAPGTALPRREELASTPVELSVFRGEDVLFAGALSQGEAARVGSWRLVLEELRLWAGIQVVRERGGGLLMTGFLLGVVGLVWRLLIHRREVVVAWDGEELCLVGRSEYYPWRFQAELDALFATLGQAGGGGSADGEPPVRRAEGRG